METNSDFMNMFISSWLPFIVLIAVYIFFMRQMKGKGGTNPMLDELKEMNATLKEISQKLDK